MPATPKDPEGAGKEKDKTPKTKPVPLDAATEFSDWAKSIPRPKQEDKGEAPPEAPQELKEPREHGTPERQEAGEPK
jgi:hypothetical protein